MNFPEVYVLNVYQLLYYYNVEYLACQYVRKIPVDCSTGIRYWVKS